MDELICDGLYRIQKPIAQGGFSIIYRAIFTPDNSTVILKASLYPQSRYSNTITGEARLLKKLNHTHIVKLCLIPRKNHSSLDYTKAYFPHESEEYTHFFVMEYLSGGSLQQYIDGISGLNEEEAVAISYPITHALCYLHQQGYAHSDIKLDNIMFRNPLTIGVPFSPVLIDFGISRRILQSDAGSHHWMAPEQLRQAKLLDPPERIAHMDHTKADVWGVGVLLYRILGGRMPFNSRRKGKLTDQIMSEYPTTLSKLGIEVSPLLEQVILEGCLAKHPQDRVSMQELMTYLKQLVRDDTVVRFPQLNKKSWWRRK